MSGVGQALVFDTGPLRHFALNGWLGVLKFVAAERRVVMPESVEIELKDQRASYPALALVLDADWIAVERADDVAFLETFAVYAQRLVAGTKNRGECGVLALGKTRGYEIVVDDGEARRIATTESIAMTGTLGLLCSAVREGQLTVATVEALADDLMTTKYRLPFGRGGFRAWAGREGLI